MFEHLIQIADRLRGLNPYEVAVEVILIWALVYLVWRFLRGTRGARVLKGAGLLVICGLLLIGVLGTEARGFERLRFLLESFIGLAAIALVIVFQPELRRALTRLGEARLFRGGGPELESVVDELVDAVAYLSKNKVGAIMAIERTAGLRGMVESGTPIDARVTAGLIKTIFWPGTALHDLGVVISGDRVMAAGVQFPLAEGEEMGQELGSRHRAAVGMSQEADCLVIVVSDETGAISLAERGQLLRKLSPDGLRAMLRRSLLAQPARGAAEGRAPERSPSRGRRRRASSAASGKEPTETESEQADKTAA